MIVILANSALHDAINFVPLITNLADSQFFLQLSVVKADFFLVFLDYVVNFRQNDL